MKNWCSVFLFALLLFTGCQPSVGEVSTAIAKTRAAQPTLTPSSVPTLTITPTSTITPTPTITLTPTPEFSQYFTENFDVDKSSWSYFAVQGRHNGVIDTGNFIPDIQDGALHFELLAKDISSYAYYNHFTYDDVRIDAKVANVDGKGNFLTIMCRYNPKVGWYEFNFGSIGLYSIYAVQVTGTNKVYYHELANGGASSIKQGMDENEFSLICQGNTLSVFINGLFIKQVTENSLVLSNGYSGVSVFSIRRIENDLNNTVVFRDRLPVKAKFDWVKFNAP